MISMVSEIFNPACEWKELSKIWKYIKNYNQVQNDARLTPILEHQLLQFMCKNRLLCCKIEFVDKFLKSVVSTHTPFAT